MNSQQHYYTGNTKQANLLLNEILPALEGSILNANKDFFTNSRYYAGFINIKDATLLLEKSRIA